MIFCQLVSWNISCYTWLVKFFKDNPKLLIIALIAVVNALGYGIIIPVLYSYSLKFGLTDFQNGLLFALFSLCQFLSTPIIGRLSDKYGRRPLLIISLAGTALSFFMMAFAPNAIFLFLARALDGITAGNIPVASAVISDTTEPKDRARGFGIIGASFGFGFVFGPAIAAFTVGISESLPFIIAGVVSIIAVIATLIFLPETNKHIGQVQHKSLFNFNHLVHALFDQKVGLTLLISLIFFTSLGIYIYAFQPFAIKALHFSANDVSILFTLFGVVGLISQILFLPFMAKRFGPKKIFTAFLGVGIFTFFGMSLSSSVVAFTTITVVHGLFSSTIQPLIQTLLSEETDAQSQGTMMGINASYMSIGQIIGPVLGGTLATLNITFPFVAASFCVLLCFIISFKIHIGVKKDSAF